MNNIKINTIMINRKIKSDLNTIRGKSPDELRRAALEDHDAKPVTREMFINAVQFGSFTPKIIKKNDVHMFLDEEIIE